MSRLALVLHDRVPADAPPDQLDTMEQVRGVARVLEQLGYRTRPLALDLDLGEVRRRLRGLDPTVVINLAESIEEDGRLAHLPAQLLEASGIPFTGCPGEALYRTTNKPLAKRLLRAAGLPTPDWLMGPALPAAGFQDPGPWLVKSVWEDASLGLDAGALVSGGKALAARLATSVRRHGGAWFAERYVEGREFNVSLLDGANGPGRPGRHGPDGPDGQRDPTVLPLAEIRFRNYPPGVPPIVDYAAKWDTASFGYRNTRRTFAAGASDADLREHLARLARACWTIFGLRGYARVDFRIDTSGEAWIIEVNANPCIAPDAGFTAAAARAGMDLRDLVTRLLAAASPPVG